MGIIPSRRLCDVGPHSCHHRTCRQTHRQSGMEKTARTAPQSKTEKRSDCAAMRRSGTRQNAGMVLLVHGRSPIWSPPSPRCGKKSGNPERLSASIAEKRKTCAAADPSSQKIQNCRRTTPFHSRLAFNDAALAPATQCAGSPETGDGTAAHLAFGKISRARRGKGIFNACRKRRVEHCPYRRPRIVGAGQTRNHGNAVAGSREKSLLRGLSLLSGEYHYGSSGYTVPVSGTNAACHRTNHFGLALHALHRRSEAEIQNRGKCPGTSIQSAGFP